jgi:hypothetical protein
LLSASAPISASSEQTAGGLLVGGWLALGWFALRRAACDPASRRWRILAVVVGLAALSSIASARGGRSAPTLHSALALLAALGPLLACAAPVALLTCGAKRSSAAAAGLIALVAGWTLGDGLAGAAWAAPLLATGAAQAVTAFDSFPLRVRRGATAALAAGLAAQAASPLAAARSAWAVALGREQRETYLEQRVGSFRAAQLLGDLVRPRHLVLSDDPQLLYYRGPSPAIGSKRSSPAANLEPPVYLLAIDPPPPDSPVERWLAARGLTADAAELTCLLDYEVEGAQASRRYRVLRFAPDQPRDRASAPHVP